MSRTSLGITVRKPFYEIMDRNNETVRGSAVIYKNKKVHCYLHNNDYWDGVDFTLELKDVKILEQNPKFENTNVFTVKEDGKNIILIAENYGTALLEYTVVLPSGREKIITCEKSVVKDIYEFEMASSTGTTRILPGAELKLETEVWHGFYNGTNGKGEWEKLKPEEYSIKFINYSENIISVDTDGTVKTVGENESVVGKFGEVDVECTIPIEGEEELIFTEYAEIYVSDNYVQVAVEEIFAAPGETINSIRWEWKTFDLEHRDGMAETEGLSYHLGSPYGIELNEAKTGFTVDTDAIDGKKIRIFIEGKKEDENGTIRHAFGTVTVNVCNHNYVQKSLKPATCTEPGTKVLECSKCHAVTKTETIPAAGHKTGDWTTVKAAACTEAGSQQQKCSVCGKVMNTKDLPKTGHSFGAWTVTAKPTALQQGTETRTCKNCKAAETRKTNKLKATIKLNVKKIPLQVKKSTTAVKVVSMTEGDGVKSWKSSNKKVATVTSKGKITGKKAGNAKITVTLKSGISASVTVKVQKKAVTTTKLTVTGKSVKKNKLTLKKGKKVTLTAVRTPVTSTEKITYKSSNKKIATVTAKGKVTGKKPGKAKITVKSGKKKVTITVTVKK